MPTYTIIRFETLTLPLVLAECRRLEIEAYRAVALAFNLWQRDFARRAYLFYRARYMQHYQVVWEQFCAEHRIPSGDPLPDRLEHAWYVRHDEELCEHSRFVQEQREQLQRFDIPFLTDQYGDPTRVIRQSPLHFDTLWFNTTINNSREKQKSLRALDYAAYLTTYHWMRVRAAMLLLHQATCQGDKCKGAGESWYGDESSLHVHHLTYTNLGNERYADLALVCKDCHAELHPQ